MIEFGDDRLPKRYWDKVRADESGCWIWMAATDRKGYGRIGRGGRKDGTIGAHVWMALVALGDRPSPSHMVLHACDDPSCVNPICLRWGTAKENSRDMVNRGRSTRKTHCLRGHELAKFGQYTNGGCIPCVKNRAHERRERLKGTQ